MPGLAVMQHHPPQAAAGQFQPLMRSLSLSLSRLALCCHAQQGGPNGVRGTVAIATAPGGCWATLVCRLPDLTMSDHCASRQQPTEKPVSVLRIQEMRGRNS